MEEQTISRISGVHVAWHVITCPAARNECSSAQAPHGTCRYNLERSLGVPGVRPHGFREAGRPRPNQIGNVASYVTPPGVRASAGGYASYELRQVGQLRRRH